MQQPTKRSIRAALAVATALGAILALAGATSAATAPAAKAKAAANAKAKSVTKPTLLTKPDLSGAAGEGDDEGGSSGHHSRPVTPGTTKIGSAARPKSGKLPKPALGRSGDDSEADD